MTKLEEAARELLSLYQKGQVKATSEGHLAFQSLRAALEEPAAEREGLTDEHSEALCEAFENEAEESHFKARPQIDFIDYRKAFRAGFVFGWKISRRIEREERK